MVFMSRWRRLKALDGEKEKVRKKTGEVVVHVMGRLENVKFFLFVTLTILLSGVLVVLTSDVLKAPLFPLNSASSLQRTRVRPMHVHNEGTTERSSYRKIAVIQDLVIFPEEILLLVVIPEGHMFPSADALTCVFGSRSSTKVISVEHIPPRVAVRCEIPPDGLDELHRGVALDQVNGAESVLIEMTNLPKEFMKWNRVVFDILSTPADVVLFAKGMAKKQGQSLTTTALKCVFDGLVETVVTSASQEVFRCDHPPFSIRQKLTGKKVTLNFDGKNLPSVVYYEWDKVTVGEIPEVKDLKTQMDALNSPLRIKESRNIADLGETHLLQKKYFLCSCTMIFNGAKFLKEWVVYHAHLGVEKFFLYDNNSEDELDDAVKKLSSYNVMRYPWPWVKTQEAGFSYCATKAQAQCTWMMFTDVDEFVYPRYLISLLSHGSRVRTTDVRAATSVSPILTTLIRDTTKEVSSSSSPSTTRKLGQISFHCLDFGPSGRTQHPGEGVMQGYTCRLGKNQRHKSIVLLEAISKSLLNVVHHFSLQPSYITVVLPQEQAVINHYKYQAWDEFKGKFRRRVSAFVADWKESKNLMSKDRTPGLGREDIKPSNWELMFCEVNDTALQNYARDTFGPVNSWE